MKDFDQEREQAKSQRTLEFTIGGETFRIKPFVKPETMDAFAVGDTRQDEKGERRPVLDVYDEWVTSMLVEEDAPKWKRVREKADPPLNLEDIENVVFWLVEAAAGRPTARSSSSAPGRRPQQATSTAPSPSPGTNPQQGQKITTA